MQRRPGLQAHRGAMQRRSGIQAHRGAVQRRPGLQAHRGAVRRYPGGYFGIFPLFATPFGYIIIDSDIGYFAILLQISGFTQILISIIQILYQDIRILQQMSGFADRIFGYFEILLQVQVPGTAVLVQLLNPDPYIKILVVE
jgi:hypothetical protein